MSSVKVKGVGVKLPIFSETRKPNLFRQMLGIRSNVSEFYALKDIDLSISSSDRVAVIGENGAGKTTLLRVLAGLLPPDEGEVKTVGKVFPSLRPAQGLIPKATCIQNMILQGLGYNLEGQALERYVSEVSKFSGLGDFLNSPLASLSQGMKSKFAVSTLKSLEPDILIMDEWIGTADLSVTRDKSGLLSELIEKSEIFVIASHRQGIVKSTCNRALVLAGGRLIYDGSVDGGYEVLEGLENQN